MGGKDGRGEKPSASVGSQVSQMFQYVSITMYYHHNHYQNTHGLIIVTLQNTKQNVCTKAEQRTNVTLRKQYTEICR